MKRNRQKCLAGTVIIICNILMTGCCTTANSSTQKVPKMLKLQGDLRVHDPVMIREGDSFYVFSTGGGRRRGIIPIRCSKDLHNWQRCGSVLDKLPEWATQEIPRARGAWAPDISFFNNRYHIYYSVSTFGRNNSAIGLVTNKTLDANSPDYKWEDQGMVVRSREDETDWNAIDGNLVLEGKDKAWLCWGSFWGGIMMHRIDPKTGKFPDKDTTIYNLAARPRESSHQTPPVEGAIEAPFIVKHKDYWYLFVSFDFCCRGARSTYRIMVGRSKKVTGPYVDKEGTAMTEGGGTELLAASEDGRWVGPGHCAVVQDISGDYLVFHAYHGETGRSELKISTIVWKDGWPKVAELP